MEQKNHNFCSLVETDSLYYDKEAIWFHIGRLCTYLARASGRSYDSVYRDAEWRVLDLIDNKGMSVFGKPTRWWDRFFHRGFRKTRLDVGIDKGKVYVKITPVAC